MAAVWRSAAARRAPFETEARIRRHDGVFRHFVIRGVPVLDADRSMREWVGTCTDITDKKRFEADLADSHEAALITARLKAQFVANLSHQIRTAMNGVAGMTGLLLDTPLTPQQRDFVETLRHSGDLLLAVINEVLDFSRIDAGRLTLDVQDFNLRDVVEGAVELLAPRAEARGLELLGVVHSSVEPRLRGDAGRLLQILSNLLDNAIKFTKHGEVDLVVSTQTETDAEVVVRFDVRDTGIGLSSEDRLRLLQGFKDAGKPHAKREGGLGLAVVGQLVALMGGQTGIESIPGRGSTFWFTARFGKSGEAAREDKPFKYAGTRVLVANDNPAHGEALQIQLSQLGMEAVPATSGDETLNFLRQGLASGAPFPLAIIDLRMPRLESIAVAKAIKADPALAQTQIIVLSSLAHPWEAAGLKAAGLAEYLIKPVKQSRLREMITEALSGGPAPESSFTPQEPPPKQKVQILLAEDNKINQKVALKQLEKLGYDAVAVGDGKEVLEAIKRTPFDIILMDCQMPEMDGYETAERIRLEHPRPIRIIALTAHALEGDREKCLSAGMDDYLTKPVRSKDLAAALEKWKPKH
jgi:two-component system sensor histidine kinase/response regulator